MKWKEGSQFENAPAGSHLARCYALIDLGTQVHSWQGETRTQRDVRLSFELPYAPMKGTYNAEVKGKPFSVHLTVKQSLHPKSTLRRYLEGWRGKKFDAQSVEEFNPKNLIGLPCRLSLIENGDYVNIDGIAPATKDEAKAMPKLINPSVFFALDEDFSHDVFKQLHEKTREKIAQSPEYRQLTDGGSSQPDGSEGLSEPEASEDDEVPF